VKRMRGWGVAFIAGGGCTVNQDHRAGVLVHGVAIGQLGRWGSVVWFRPGELAKLQREAREA
jgi:hypothetical protein